MNHALLLVGVWFVVLVHGTGRWRRDSPEERWSLILENDQRINDLATRMQAGSWHVAGHAHKLLNQTHLIITRPRGEQLASHAHPSRWPGVVSAKHLIPQPRSHRALIDSAPQEPLWERQWHLHDFDFPPEYTPEQPAHISVVPAWMSGATGMGVHIAVVDDGLQSTHPDIKTQFDARGSYDFNYDKPSVEPTMADSHGTSAGGTAAAGINAACGAGIAPYARLSGIRLLAEGTVTDEQEALSLSYEDQRNHIYSNSWGPYDDAQRLEGPGELTRAAMAQSIKYGRLGRGVIYVWAAGNGRTVGDNCNWDGYANNRYTITVPAVTSLGTVAGYSEDCSANVVAAPSSAGDALTSPYKIVTTGLVGGHDSTAEGCYLKFGGTSAAAPVVAGVVALMLSVRPELGWRDVQGVLIHSADITDPTSPSWQTNGAGLLYSHSYGFGRVNASRAVELSRQWAIYPEDIEIATPLTPFVGNAPTSTVHVANNLNVEAVSVTFVARVPARGRLAIKLTSPSGTVSFLSPFHRDTNSDYNGWTFGSVAHWDEKAAGAWTLSLESQTNVTGQWRNASWKLNIYGHV